MIKREMQNYIFDLLLSIGKYINKLYTYYEYNILYKYLPIMDILYTVEID